MGDFWPSYLSSAYRGYPRERSIVVQRSGLHAGFTLAESAISLVVFVLLITAVLTITVETSSLLGDNETDHAIQQEGSRAFGRVTEILRKSGRVLDDEILYPRVLNGGRELEFRVLEDTDGNGYAFDQSSGELEWSATVYSIRLAENELGVYEGTNLVHSLARNVSFVRFATIAEDTSLSIKEIAIAIETRRTLKDGHELTFTADGSVHMRN